MSDIDQIVQVNISLQAATVPQASFGIMLILGSSNVIAPDYVRTYGSPSALLADGFTTSDEEYIHAVEAFEQPLTPPVVLVGRRTAQVTQVDTVTVPTVADNTVYTLALNGANASYTSGVGATANSILTGLKAALDALLQSVTFVVGGSSMSATSTIPGKGFSLVAITSNLAVVVSTPNHGIVEDITRIQAINDTWYALDPISEDKNDLLEAAGYIETQLKIMLAATADADVPSAVSTDVASIMKSKSYNRSGLFYSIQSGVGQIAAWLGGQLPITPGGNTYKFKELIGITPDKYTDSQRTVLIGLPLSEIPGKNVNIYEVIGGVPITREGTMASGQFIDLTIGVDWLKSRLQEAILTGLVQAAKIPYTNKGVAIIVQQMNSVFQQGITNGLIADDTPYSISFPNVQDIPQAERANRVLPDGKFSCRFAGAIHGVKINGTVTV